jgi:rfaE bifunctional protein nucleotidyltransferase chain/domain
MSALIHPLSAAADVRFYQGTQWDSPKPRTVLAHGVFDILHLGHVRYLEAARQLGDELVVSITSDRYAGKAPGRPVFKASFRAEMVAALECVDRVVISDHPTAVDVIHAIRPAVYAKGAEYTDTLDADETKAVTEVGGRVAFIDTPTMSSSALINRHVEDQAVAQHLEAARSLGYAEHIARALDRMSRMRVLFVGETIIDEYQYLAPLGKPSKEMVVCGHQVGTEAFNGGVEAAAAHARSFCAGVKVLSYRTLTKTRMVERDTTRKLFEVYRGEMEPLDRHTEDALLSDLCREMVEADVVVVTDFGHGMMTPAVRDALHAARFLAVNTQTNAGNHGYNLVTKYDRADYACIDAPEARLACGQADIDLGEAARRITGMMAERVCITQGRHGSLYLRRGSQAAQTCPAFTTRAVDTIGAGDAYLAITAPLAAALAQDVAINPDILPFVGNIAGAIKVGIIGHRQSVDKETLLRYMGTLLK